MRRRQFLSFLGGAAAAWPLTAQAQNRGATRRIAVLLPFGENDPESQATKSALEQKLQELGWTSGRNIHIDYRYAAGGADSLRAHAGELMSLSPDVIVARTTPAAAAMLRETQAIPIVFVGVADPVGAGFSQSLARPGRNMTGFTNFEPGMGGKWLETLREIAPSVSRAALLFNPKSTPYAEHYRRSVETAAVSLSISAISIPVESRAALEDALAELARERGSGLIVMPDVFTTNHSALILKATAEHGIPSIYPFRYFVERGGLISYGVDTIDQVRRVPSYVDRILKGEKAADLPVQTPTKFELAINAKTAKALHLTVPATLLARADAVIE